MRVGSAPAAALAGLLLATSGGAAPVASPSPGPSPEHAGACRSYGEAARSGAVPDALDELSGLAASRVHDGVFWAHNDSGNAFELIAIDASGDVRATFPLRGSTSRDIEDVAVGPCGEGAPASCVYLADAGDNRRRRPDARIYRLPEPDVLDGRPVAVDVLRFVWPDGPENSEAMLVDPRDGRVFVWTKEADSLGIVHRLEGLAPGKTGRAVPVVEVRAGARGAALTTGADAHPAGDRVLVRTYADVFELRRDGAASLEDVLRAAPEEVPAGRQRQAESVAYRRDGLGYLLGTEGAGGPLWAVGCAQSEKKPATEGDQAPSASRSSS